MMQLHHMKMLQTSCRTTLRIGITVWMVNTERLYCAVSCMIYPLPLIQLIHPAQKLWDTPTSQVRVV